MSSRYKIYPMKLSFNQTTSPNVRDDNGYGYAAKMCKQSLLALGHEVEWRDPTADVEINFIQPEKWVWTGPYRIAYLPWESTGFRDGWVDSLNECDEVWTPSPVVAGWMKDAGVTKDIKVYQHGVDTIWNTGAAKRLSTGTFEVIHHGAEALRKGGNETIQAFMATLWDEDARLTMKMLLSQFNLHDTEHIRIKKTKLPLAELVALYHEEQLMCYPSYGEGFGLVPLQAMASGMPVLVTKGWAPYEYLLGEENLISSQYIDSPWPEHHPGQVIQPDEDDLRDKLRWHFENRESQAESAWNLTSQVMADYDWVTLTARAFEHLT